VKALSLHMIIGNCLIDTIFETCYEKLPVRKSVFGNKYSCSSATRQGNWKIYLHRVTIFALKSLISQDGSL